MTRVVRAALSAVLGHDGVPVSSSSTIVWISGCCTWAGKGELDRLDAGLGLEDHRRVAERREEDPAARADDLGAIDVARRAEAPDAGAAHARMPSAKVAVTTSSAS